MRTGLPSLLKRMCTGLPRRFKRLRKSLVDLLKEERPGRKGDRAVKALPQRYTVRVLKKDLH